MNSALLWIRGLAAGALAALLPQEERQRIEGRFQIQAAPWSMAFGFVEFFVGLGLFLSQGIDRMRGGASGISDELLRQGPNSLTSAHIGGGGIVGWLSWLISPLAWLLLALAVIGGLRIANFVAHREAMAEPAVWLGVRGYRKAREALRRRKELRQLGPIRPDRLSKRSDGQLRIVCCRAQAQWVLDATVRVDDAFYRVASLGTVKEQDGMAIAYELVPLPPGAVIRGRLTYSPTTPKA